MKITYLSHGALETGGYFHEKFLCETLSDGLNNCDICYKEIRFRKYFHGVFGWLVLAFKSFFAARGEVIVTVARLAWPVYLRNMFNKNKIVVVIHNFDEQDGKPRLYHFLLRRFFSLALRKNKKICIVTVSDFWRAEFVNRFGQNLNVFRFPNLFNRAEYQLARLSSGPKSNLIHLGQWSDKIDRKAYLLLIDALKNQGFICYFSDNTGAKSTDFPISFFATPKEYLKQMATSKATVILNRVNEGWNRVAHESFLVGTQVMTTSGGGLGDLVQLANGYVLNSIEEVNNVLVGNTLREINDQALDQFDKKNAASFAAPIVNWITADE